ncbi:MAG TPA: ABC transporter ATP-binding protein [Egibacteraceae bacterium]|nr:ABC transporter ATP-binding protein [Egibacteraceae bacterium]
MSSALERDLAGLVGRNGTPPGPFEPVAVTVRYPPPPAGVDPDPSKGWLQRIRPLVAARRRPLLLALGAALVALCAQIAAPRVIMAAIDDALVGARAGLAPYVGVLVGLAVARGLFTWAQRASLFSFAFDLESDLRVLLYGHLGRMPFGFFDRVDSGELISRANSDVRAVQLFLSFAPLLALQLAGLALAFGLMLSVHVSLTLVAAVPLIGVLVAGARMRARLYPLSWVVQARQAEVAGVVAENVSGVRVVRSFAAEQRQLEALAGAARRLHWASVRQLDVRAAYGPAMENLPRLAVVGVLGYGGWLVVGGQVTVGAVIAFAAYVGLLQPPFRMLGATVMMAQRAAASAGRIYELLDRDPAIRDHPDAVELTAPRGELCLRGVVFGYDPANPVLAGLDLTVAPGETVALVGRTGSGKSTVARLVARFYDVDDGEVRVDGHDVRRVRLASLRAGVGVVFDEPFLFGGTLRDNIAYARPEASDAEIRAAARVAQAAGFIEALPDGYDTPVGERGYTLSGGQRQRVALARAVLADPAVLVLDDATSAVDAEVEEAIHRALAERSPGRTTLMITHRESTIGFADRVVLVEDGTIVASGDHGTLLATEPRYAAVLDRQPLSGEAR